MTIIREERKYTTALQMDDNFQDSSLNTAHQKPDECEGLMTDTSIMLTGGYNLNVKLSKCNTRKKESPSKEDINLNRMSTVCGEFVRILRALKIRLNSPQISLLNCNT